MDDKKKLRYTVITAILLFVLSQCFYLAKVNQNVFRKEEITPELCYKLIDQTLESYVEKPKIEVVSIQEKEKFIIAGYLLGEKGSGELNTFTRHAGRLTFFLEKDRQDRYVLTDHAEDAWPHMKSRINHISYCTVSTSENGKPVEYLVVISDTPKLRAIELLDGTELSEIAVEGNPSMTLVPLPIVRGGDWRLIFE